MQALGGGEAVPASARSPWLWAVLGFLLHYFSICLFLCLVSGLFTSLHLCVSNGPCIRSLGLGWAAHEGQSRGTSKTCDIVKTEMVLSVSVPQSAWDPSGCG